MYLGEIFRIRNNKTTLIISLDHNHANMKETDGTCMFLALANTTTAHTYLFTINTIILLKTIATATVNCMDDNEFELINTFLSNIYYVQKNDQYLKFITPVPKKKKKSRTKFNNLCHYSNEYKMTSVQ